MDTPFIRLRSNRFSRLLALAAIALVALAWVPGAHATTGTCETLPGGVIEVEGTGGAAAQPTGYSTLRAAFVAINNGAHTGGTVVIDVCGSTTEVFPSFLAASGGTATYSAISILPVGGTWTISGNIPDALILLHDADNVTIDGLNGGSTLTLDNANTGAAARTILFRADASNNTVRNCTIRGASTSLTSGTIAIGDGATTGNVGNVIDNNTITSSGANLPANAIYSAGLSTSVVNTASILNNNIQDYFNAGSASNGILVASNSAAWTITGNRFFQTATRTSTASASNNHRAINIITASGGGYSINSNIIGFATSGGAGTTTYAGAFTNRFFGIEVTAANTPVSDIQGNTISGISLTTSTGAANVFAGINVLAGSVNVGTTGVNIVGATTGTGAVSVTSSTTGAIINGIIVASTGTSVIQDNFIGSINTGGAAAIGYVFNGILTSGAAGNVTISGNTIGSTTPDSIAMGTSGTTTAVTTMVGVSNSATGTISITGNTIRNCSSFGTGASTFIGITNTGGTGTLAITSNSVIAGTKNGTGTSVGISNSAAVATANINSNVLRNITMNGATGAFTGITSTGAVTSALNVNSNHLGNASGGLVTYSVAHSSTLTGILTSGTTTAAVSVSDNDFRGITHSVQGTNTHTYISVSNATSNTANIDNNRFRNLNVNTTGSVTFITRSGNIAATGVENCTNNSIVTAFNKGGSGGTVTFYGANASSVTGSAMIQTGNNFFNVTVTGTTTIAGWSNTDGASSSSGPTKTITGNTFSNISTSGTGSITGMSVNFSGAGTVISTNTISSLSTLPSGGSTTGITLGSSNGGTATCGSNSISGLSAGTVGSATGITSGSLLMTISGNTISNLSSTNTTGTVLGLGITGGTTVSATGNTINGLSGTGTSTAVATGLSVSGGTTVTVSKNKIYDIAENGTSTSTPAVNGILLSGGTTVTTANNIIGDLKAPTVSNADAIRGINVSSAVASSTQRVYFNTVYLTASSSGAIFGTTGIFHAASTVATTATLDLRNNIIDNRSSNNTTGLTVAYRRSSALASTLNNYATTSNNNDFFLGNVVPPAGRVTYYNGTLSAVAIADYKAWSSVEGTIAPRDTASFADPTYQSTTPTDPNYLHINLVIPTQVESGGSPGSGITDDFDGDARGATPDVGADEFSGTGLDLSGPVISYTPLSRAAVSATRAFSPVTITDASGVNGTAGLRPRVYYKRLSDLNQFNDNTSSTAGWKFVEASGASSPFSFTITYSLLSGGLGVTVGDTIQYFVVAQDLATTPNVGINSGVFNSPPSSVALTGAAFPITGTINSYNIVDALNGTYTVCASGCAYPSLTNTGGVFADINAKVISGNLRIEIAGDLTGETGTNGLNPIAEDPVGSYTVTIVPTGVARSVTGTGTGTRLIPILGADRVVIDGSLGGGGTDRSLTFSQTNTAAGTGNFFIGSLGTGAGSTDITVKNCIIKAGNIGTTANFTFGVFVGDATGAAAGADNDNFTFRNNQVLQARTGLQMVGTAAGVNNNAMIVDNTFGDDVFANSIGRVGMSFSVADSATISGNTIKNVYLGVTDTSNTIGLSVGTLTGTNTISQNSIINLRTTASSSFPPIGMIASGSSGVTISQNTIDGVAGGFGGVGSGDVYGLALSTGFVNSTVTRNTIASITYGGTGGYAGRGLDINTGSLSSNLTITNNSISNIKGDGWNSFASDSIAGIRITGSTGGLNFYFNSVNLGSGTFAGNSSGTLSAAMYVGASASALDIRNNVFATNLVNSAAALAKTYAIYSDAAASAYTNIDYNDYFASGTQGVLGFFASSIPTDRVTITDWRNSTGKDLASISADPLFTSATNLRPSVGSPLLGAGFPIGSVLIDLPGDTRSVTNPTIGAYENPNAADLAVTKTDSPDPVATQTNITYTITVTNNGPLAATNPTLSDTTPVKTTFVSITPPAGWTCPTTPVVGGTGAISCTATTLASGASAVFTLVVKVDYCVGNTSTTNTATVSSGVPDPNMANNTAMETTLITDDNTCNDGDACTSGDMCDGSGDGICHNTGGCEDNNPCTDNVCDPSPTPHCEYPPIVCNTPPDVCHSSPGTCTFPGPGVCEYPNAPNGTSCSDGDPCTVSDACDTGVCEGEAKDCSDGNVCTTDTCNPSDGVCLHGNLPNGTSCDDGESCSVNDVCSAGAMENFDGATPPALPSGWTTTVIPGSATAWATTTTQFHSAPNSAFAPDPAINTDNRLEWGPISIATSTAKLSFQKRYALEASGGSFYDGVVLEIKIGSNPNFVDILAAGGSFASGGYDPITISACCNNVLAGRAAWSGSSLTFTSTVVNLPASAAGETIYLRWRLGSDDTVAATGFWLDSVAIDETSSCHGVAGNTGFVCRPAAGSCDVAEACNGTIPTCPADAVRPLNDVCLQGDATGCNPDDKCDGVTVTCAPVIAPDGTSCTDSDFCTSADTCASGLCSGSNTITVSPNNLNGWSFVDDTTNGPGSGTFTAGPGVPPMGTGSVRLALATAGDRQIIGTFGHGGVRLADVTHLQYSTYRSSVDAGDNLAITLQFDVDYDLTNNAPWAPTGTGTRYQGRLVFEPYISNGAGTIPQNTWQTWDVMAGKWWSSGAPGNSVCTQGSPCTTAQVLMNWPDIGIHANISSPSFPNGTGIPGRLLLKSGGPGPAGFDASADQLILRVGGAMPSDTTYNFETTDPCGDTSECTTDSCSSNACVHTPVAEFTVCGDQDSSVCNAPDSCNATGVCVDRKKALNTVCSPGDASGCNPDDVCDGMNNACAPLYAAEFTACGDPDIQLCNAPDSCNDSGSCIDRKKAANTVCLPGDASGCNPDDVCDGTTNACAQVIAPEFAACGDPDTTACNAADSCNPSGTCVDRKKPLNAVCLPGDASGCNPDDLCDGTTNTCAPVYTAEFTACGDPDNTVCNEPDSCGPTGTCVNRVKPVNTLCSPAAGDCDVDDFCDGIMSLCKATYQPSSHECRASSATCDPAEFCTGSNATCPADTVNASQPVGDSVRVSHNKVTAVSTVSWNEPAPGPFNVYRGARLNGNTWVYNHGCYAPGLNSQSTTNTQTPISGQMWYFLVSRDDTHCPESSLGPDSGGTDRPNATFCPNPGSDSDFDGVISALDNCPTTYNPSQSDVDMDGIGDACDNCIITPNQNQGDLDNDGVGDVCDTDIDNDGLTNNADNCPRFANPAQTDTDGDGVGDDCDNCPTDFNPTQADVNNNGTGDACE